MIIAGVNLGVTVHGKALKDGASCLIIDGVVRNAVAEERITRRKHDGGFSTSLKCCLQSLSLEMSDVDLIVVSSCCEGHRKKSSINEFLEVPDKKFRFLDSHHLSHACSTYYSSPFDEALVVVIDGGGSVLSELICEEWWSCPREQASYYVANNRSLTLIARDFEEPYSAGFGEVFRYATKFLGWSTQNAGNTMALAVMGDAKRFSVKPFFRFDKITGKIESLLINNPLDPINTFADFGNQSQPSWGEPRLGTQEIQENHKDIAAHVQTHLEELIIQKIRWLSSKTGLKKLCLAGGVALNCVINQKILEATPIQEIFIQPAASDQGQALGNALFGASESNLKLDRVDFFSPYLGPEHDLDKECQSAPSFAKAHLMSEISFQRLENKSQLVRSAAEDLSSGKVIGWCQGRSEYGPRALGNRSLLADPRTLKMKERLNAIKKRPFFSPIAPSVIEGKQHLLNSQIISSPYMLLALQSTAWARSNVPCVVHYDGSTRVQTVTNKQNPTFYDLIIEFEALTGIPLVANTSFNFGGEPIVEGAEDAIDAFLRMDIDCLYVGYWRLAKSI